MKSRENNTAANHSFLGFSIPLFYLLCTESGYFYYITIIAKALQTKTLAIFLFPTCSIFAPFLLDLSAYSAVR